MFDFSEKQMLFSSKQQSPNLALPKSSYEREQKKVPKKERLTVEIISRQPFRI
jgi:hypothetical protein